MCGSFEIVIGLFIAADERSKNGHNVAHVGSDKQADDIFCRWRSLQTGDASSGFEDSVLFFQHAFDIDDIAEHESRHNSIKAFIGKGELADIGNDPGDIGVVIAFLSKTDHLGCEVNGNDFRLGGTAQDLEGEFTGAGPNIECAAMYIEIQVLDGLPAPASVLAQGYDAVDQVVSRGQACEHLADASLPLVSIPYNHVIFPEELPRAE